MSGLLPRGPPARGGGGGPLGFGGGGVGAELLAGALLSSAFASDLAYAAAAYF